MATATIDATLRPTVIDNAEAVTNWGGDTFALNANLNIQGTNCVETVQTATGNNDVYVTGTWDFSGTGSGDQHLRLWFLITYVGNLSTTNPIQVFLYDGTNTAYYYWDKAVDYQGGWAQAVIYTGDTPDSGTVTKSSITRIGLRFVTASKPRNVPWNALFDAWTYGDGYTVTGGTSADPIDWSHIAAADFTDQFGIVKEYNGIYFLAGDIKIGNGTTTTYFEPSGQLCMFTDEQVSTSLYQVLFQGSGCNVDISGGAMSIDGTTLDFVFDADETNLNALTMDGLQMSKAGLSYFKSGQTIQNCTFDNCDQITPSTSTFENNTVSNYVGAAVDGALSWPGGTSVKNCSFLNNDEAIEITQTTNQTFDNLLFSGNTDDVHLNNGGTDIDVSKTNGSNPTSQVSTGGGTVTFVGASVTVYVKAVTTAGADVVGARVLVKASDGTGPFPFEDAVTSIVNSGTTATVTTTLVHGMASSDYIEIAGASLSENNGVFQVTVTGTSTFTYTMGSTPGSSPTGTITATFVALSGVTDVNGEISTSRVYPTDQPVTGHVRKSTSSPYYKTSNLLGTVDSASGYSATAVLVSDE